jgi:hypothetical protein
MQIKMKNPKPPPEQPDQPGPATTLDERTRHLCELLEKQMRTGKLRLSFGNYLRLMQLREAKGYNRPQKTTVTWADPWWVTLIEEMEGREELKAVVEEFRAKGLEMRKKESIK